MPVDWAKLLELAPLAFAKPGSPEGAAMLQGFLQSKQRREQERQQQQQRAADNERANQQLEMTREQHALQRLTQASNAFQPWVAQLGETATDPAAAQQQLATQADTLEQAYHIPTGQLAAMAPTLAPMISARKTKHAKTIYAQLEKRFAAKDATGQVSDPAWETSINFKSEEFGDLEPGNPGHVHPATLRTLFEGEAFNAQGQPATPATPHTKPSATPGSFEDYLGAPPERQAQIQAARKKYAEAGKTEPSTPVTRYSRATVIGPDGNLIETNYDAVSGGYYDVDTGKRLTGVKPTLPSGGMGVANIQLRNTRAAAALNSIEQLKQLAPVRTPGPLGIAQGIREVAKGYAGYSTKTRQFQAMLQPTAMQMAVAIQGAANLSDTERQVMAGMLGSINTMDYESQMALLDSAVALLRNGADVEKVGGLWKVRKLGGGTGSIEEWGRDPITGKLVKKGGQ